MKNLFILFAIIAITTGCNQGDKSSSDNSVSDQKEVTIATVTVDQVLEAPEKYAGTEVKISGLVTHVCKHGGQKLFIIGDDPESQLRINVGQDIPEFDIALEGSTVEFTGKVLILEEDITAALAKENEEKEHHTGDEAHAKAESASYFVEAAKFKELPTEI